MVRLCAPPPTCFFKPTQLQIPNYLSITLAAFAQLTTESRYASQRSAPFSFKIAPFHKEIWIWFIGSTRFLNPNGISIGLAIFAGLTTVTYRQTDRPRYSVSNNRSHLRT